MKNSRIVFVGLLLSLLSACTKSSPYPIIDIHAHVMPNGDGADAATLVSAMEKYKVTGMVLMNPPSAFRFEMAQNLSQMMTMLEAYPEKFRYMYGGEELNYILHALGRSEPMTYESIYPNAADDPTTAQTQIDALKAIAADPATWEAAFKTAATDAAATKKYVGFGEFGALHLSHRAGHPYIIFPVNHPLMKWLSDLAAANSMVLDIHMEGTDEKIAELSDLLTYNPSTRIMWDHAGWSISGTSTAERVAELMANHANLYLSLKLRKHDDKDMLRSAPLDEDGNLKKEWAELIQTYSNRIMIGMDPKYWNEGSETPEESIKQNETLYAELFFQLPKDTATAISNTTAKAVFGF